MVAIRDSSWISGDAFGFEGSIVRVFPIHWDRVKQISSSVCWLSMSHICGQIDCDGCWGFVVNHWIYT